MRPMAIRDLGRKAGRFNPTSRIIALEAEARKGLRFQPLKRSIDALVAAGRLPDTRE